MKKLMIVMLALMLFVAPAFGSYGRRVYLVSIVDSLHEKNDDEVTSFTVNIAGSTAAKIYANAHTTTEATNPIVDSSTATDITTLTDGYVAFWYSGATCDIILSDGTFTKTHSSVTPQNTRLMFDSHLYTAMTEFELLDAESLSFGTHDDWVAQSSTIKIMTWTPLANDSSFWIGTTGAVADLLLWGDTSGYDLMWDASDNRLEFDDDAILGIGNAPDWYIVHSGGTTTATGALTHASAQTFSTDCLFTGNGYNVEWDNSSDTLHFLDSAELGLGGATTADGDVVFKHNGTDFTLTTIRASEPWKIGGTTNGFDITYYFATAGTLGIDHDGDIFSMSDDMFIGWGNTTADPDIKIEWDTAGTDALLIEGKTADTEIKIGYTTNLDFGVYGATNSAYVLFNTDASAYRVDFEGFDLRVKDDDYIEFGDAAEVTMNYDEDGDNDLQVKGPVDFETTYCKFQSNPVTAKIAGGAATGTAGDENCMAIDGTNFEYHVIGTQTILAPVIVAGGLNIAQDEANNDGVEITEGITSQSKSAFTIGTDAFYLKVKVYFTDVTGTDDFWIGFRLAEAYQSDNNAYDSYACIGHIAGDLTQETEVDGGTETTTDLNETNWADTASHELGIFIAANKAVTFTYDGSAPGSAAAFSWGATDTVVPYIYLRHDTDIAETTYLMTYECGLQ